MVPILGKLEVPFFNMLNFPKRVILENSIVHVATSVQMAI